MTYADGGISTDAAVKILGVSKNKCKDGVIFMASETVPTENDVLHFDELGISSLELTAEEAAKLATKDGVLSVEEDMEMFGLNSPADDERQYDELFMNSEEMVELSRDVENVELNAYNKALLDVFSSILEAKENEIKGHFRKPEVEDASRNLAFQPIPWHINLVKAPVAWKRGITGRGVNIAILDSGIARHPDLVISGGVSFIPGETSFNDLNGHGTHCAGIAGARNNSLGVVGVAPDARIFAVKVLKELPNGRTSGQAGWIISAMEWCIRNKMKVASMSLGSASGPSNTFATAVKRCQDHGVTVVVAAGNSFGTAFPWVCNPANSVIPREPNASPIAVGAVDRNCAIANFSSRGARTSPWNQVFCVAPGVAVNSTYLGNGYRALPGTSMACPHVAGLAALIIQRYPGISPANVKRRIGATCTDLGPRGFDQAFGFGLINCDLATR